MLFENYSGGRIEVGYAYADGKFSADLSFMLGQPIEDATVSDNEIDLSSIIGGGPDAGGDL